MEDILALIIGIIMFIGGILFLISVFKVRFTCNLRTDAVISYIKYDFTYLRGTKVYSYRPVYTYTVNGVTYEEEAFTATSKENKYKINDRVTLYVNEKEPQIFAENIKPGFVIASIVLAAAGAVMIALFFI